jgi:hypothetical protein
VVRVKGRVVLYVFVHGGWTGGGQMTVEWLCYFCDEVVREKKDGSYICNGCKRENDKLKPYYSHDED